MNGTQLPSPTDAQEAHSQALIRALADLGQSRALSFAEYMNHVLYAPALGYYMAGAQKFGEAGDFTTAPEMSPLFAQSLAVQCEDLFQALGPRLLELGAGSGRLAEGLCAALGDLPGFSYTILEPSAELQARQAAHLASALPAPVFDRVQWISAWPAAFCGIVLANEVMDALPVERFVAGESLAQIEVRIEGEGSGAQVVPTLGPAGERLTEAVSAIERDLGRSLAKGYCSEICLLLDPWIASMAESIERGVILLIDYGYPRREYYLEERCDGTLRCHYRHRAHDDPYVLPGLQDITAHVDFTRVAEAAQNCELALLGYASQASFLLDNDLLRLADARRASLHTEIERIQSARQIKQLTLPGEMGERFQVMALGKGYDRALRGFTSQDLTHRL